MKMTKIVLTIILLVSSFNIFAAEEIPNILRNGLPKLSYGDLVKVQKYSKRYLYLSDSDKIAFHEILNSIDCKAIYLGYNIDSVNNYVSIVLKQLNKGHLNFLNVEKDKLSNYMSKEGEMAIVASIGKFHSTHAAFMVVLKNILYTFYDVNFSSLETKQKKKELGLQIAHEKGLITDLQFWKNCDYYSERTADVFDSKIKKEIYEFIPNFIKELDKVLEKLNTVVKIQE